MICFSQIYIYIYHITYDIVFLWRWEKEIWDLQYAFCKLDRYIKNQFYSDFFLNDQTFTLSTCGIKIFFSNHKKNLLSVVNVFF
jgi:hypothetical protein